MFNWLLILVAYLPFQIALNPGAGFDLASLRVFIILFFVIWLVRKIWISDISYLKNLQAIGLFLFLILAGFSLIKAENVFWGLRKIIFFLSIFPLYFLVIGLVNNWLKIRKIILVLISSSILIALIGLIQFLAPFIFGLNKVYEFWTWQIIPIFSGLNFGALIMAYPSWLVNVNGHTILRAFSFFSDPHMLSFYLGLILPLAIALSLKISKKIPLFIICCLLFVVLLLTFTRGAYLSVIVTFLVLAGLFWRYLRAKKIAWLLCLSLLIFIIPNTPISDRFYSSFSLEEGSNIGRLEMWQQAGQVGWQHPWQGVGLGNYSLLVDSGLGYRNPITAHNLYLDIFSEMGILNLLVWLILILGAIWQLFWQMRRSNLEQKYLYLGLIGSLVYFSIHSFFETAIYHPSILALLMIILGLSTILCSKRLSILASV